MSGETAVETSETGGEQSGESGDFSENLSKAVAKAQGEPLEGEPVEAKEEPKAEGKPKSEKKLAPKFVALRKRAEEAKAKEEHVRQTASQLQAREAQIAAYEKQLREREARASELEGLTKDPRKLLSWLTQQGVSLEDVNVAAFADADPAIKTQLEIKRQAAEVAELRRQLEQRDQERKRELEELSTREHRAYVASQEKAFVAAIQAEGFEAVDEAYGEDEQLRVAYHLNALAGKRGLGWGIQELAEATKELAEAGLTVNSSGEVVRNVRYERIRGRKAPSPTQTNAPKALASAPKTLTPAAVTERSSEAPSLDDMDWQTRTRIIAERARRLG